MWIQSHDFSSEEMDGATAEQAKTALATFDWLSEIEKQNQSGDENCDPGLGLISNDGSILHICPRDKESCSIHYHYPTSKKVLGFIPVTSQESHYIEKYSMAKATELIDHHFDGKQTEILKTK